MGLENELKRELIAQGVNLKEYGSIHLAVVNEPYYSYIINGKKTIESRFTKNCVAPYNKVKKNDIVLIKRAGHLIYDFFVVKSVCYYLNTPKTLHELKTKYSFQICADDKFWEERKDKKYISLIEIGDKYKLLNPIKDKKKDKRGWITINHNTYRKVYLIAGKIGSGKTWTSIALSNLLEFDRCSFSNYVKWKCERLNLAVNRNNLNEVGKQAVRESIDEFIYYIFNCVAEKKNDNIIIDGLRHIKVLSEIKKYCNHVRVIYIDLDKETILKHLEARDTLEEDNKVYSEESELPLIKEQADIIVNDGNEIEIISNYIKNDISNQLRLF